MNDTGVGKGTGGFYRLRAVETLPVTGPTLPEGREGRSVLPAVPTAVRLQMVLAVLMVFGLVLAAQLVRYQVVAARRLPAGADAGTDNAALRAVLPRGTIVDRRGHPLALETYAYQVTASPRDMLDREAAALRLAPLLGVDAGDLMQRFAAHADSAYLPLGFVGPAAGEAIRAMRQYTITAEPLPRRYYPEGRLAAHVLGFVAADRRGYYGLEGYYDAFLRANTPHPAPPTLTADDLAAAGLPQTVFLPSYVQQDLVLTLDRHVQYRVEKALRQAIATYQAESGTIIVLIPHGSAILAMASWPDFDPNRYTEISAPDAYVNQAISVIYEPGSVFKLITYAAALDKGVITPQSRFQDTRVFVYGEKEIHNWDRQGHGTVTAAYALAESLNVTTAKIAVALGRTEFYKAVQRFGFGQLTGVELANEVPGLVKYPGRSAWYPADLATNSFGQGISVTPLQMANAVATIASGGVLYRPHIVSALIQQNRVELIPPQPLNRVITAATARTLTEMMVQTVERTPDLPIPGYAVAGKSGTAEIPLPNGYVDEYTITSFAGFFPADDPQFVILVKLDRPKTSKWATYTAAPLFRQIVLDLIELYAIPPDRVRHQLQAGGNARPLLTP
jgi:cell division protein FtsI/penicillin-binding protein 2